VRAGAQPGENPGWWVVQAPRLDNPRDDIDLLSIR